MSDRPTALLTDWYQLTMLDAYVRGGMDAPAVFELFFRRLPAPRRFLVAAGLEQALAYLEELRFDEAELAWLAATGQLDDRCLAYLARLRFDGDVDAMPEGTICFADEPVLRVVAPLPVAQLVESRLLNLVHFQTVVASKAARCVAAADGAPVVDFGFRRAHGAEAGVLAARAAYLAGFAGTATVEAGRRFGVPLVGTMGHAFIQAHDDEEAAFERFARARPQDVVLLLDTSDTEAAARRAVTLAPRLAGAGITIGGVRLDSGDLAAHARAVRAILDAGGLHATTILASGNLDEYALAALRAAHAPIDGFGIGTHLTTSVDAPALDAVYKLQEYAGRPRRKHAEGKATWPGRKQVYRRYDGDGRMIEDVLTLEGDLQDGAPLLRPVVRAGRRVGERPTLADARARARVGLDRLPPALRTLDTGAPFPLRVAPALQRLAASLSPTPP